MVEGLNQQFFMDRELDNLMTKYSALGRDGYNGVVHGSMARTDLETMVLLLLDHGADPNAMTWMEPRFANQSPISHECSILHAVCLTAHYYLCQCVHDDRLPLCSCEALELLLSAGADPNTPSTKNGESALSFARRKQCHELIQLLTAPRDVHHRQRWIDHRPGPLDSPQELDPPPQELDPPPLLIACSELIAPPAAPTNELAPKASPAVMNKRKRRTTPMRIRAELAGVLHNLKPLPDSPPYGAPCDEHKRELQKVQVANHQIVARAEAKLQKRPP